MRRATLFMMVTCLLLSFVLMSCGGYVKKDELEKQLSGQKMDIEQKVQLAQDSAATANDKAEKALSATKGMDKIKEDILATVDNKIDSSMAASKGDFDKYSADMKRIAQEAASKALADANSTAMTEDDKVKQMAKEAADKAMNAAMEADRRAQEAARQAELAKTLPVGAGEGTVFAVYFDPGKIKIKAEGEAELEKAANMIKENSGVVVKIEGHADNTPVTYSKYHNNWLLSQARSDAVYKYLTDKLGVSADRIKQNVGFSDYKPAAPNDKKNKWENRRVEVIISR